MASLYRSTEAKVSLCASRIIIFFLLQPLLFNNSNIYRCVIAAAAQASSSSSRSTASGSLKLQQDYPALFVFGDSLSDTGNAAFIQRTSNSSAGAGFHITEEPYGQTFPGWPTGRYSDGLLFVDFLASYLGLPFANPFLNSTANFERGVNYAVGGATALDASFLQNLNITPASNFSLDAQLSWHLDYKDKVESFDGSLLGSPSLNSFEDGLYILEIGGNDYMGAFVANYSQHFVYNTLVPLVLERVIDTVEVLLKNGAKRFLFISLTPFGCTPYFLSTFGGFKDDDGCLEDYNLVASFHGERIQDELKSLRILYSHATFSFMDYFSAYIYILRNNKDFGFLKDLKACCGAGQDYPYNFNSFDLCNAKSESLCENPSTYFIWDGVHPTESMNSHAFLQALNITSFKETQNSPI